MDDAKPSLSSTQELTPPTAADVLEVFQHFQEQLLSRIDVRDGQVLKLFQKATSEVLEQYTRMARTTNEHEHRLGRIEDAVEDLRRKHNELVSEMQAIKLRVGSSERR